MLDDPNAQSQPPAAAPEPAGDATPSTSTVQDQEHVRKCLNDADELKQEGNEHFRARRWDEALASYRAALGRLPKRSEPARIDDKGKARATDESDDDEAPEKDSQRPESTPMAQQESLTGVQLECAKARAVLNANIGACYMKLGDHKEVVTACTEALKDDPTYIKALQRRAAANEQIDSWSSLSSAQEDYKRLVELLPSRSPDVVAIRRTLASLPPRIEAAQKRETAEMLDKLKGLGNRILGNFGLSTDNFQFVPNGQGGYSMNFVR
ncbi:TPR-like protein [Trametes punicea]|nr:TPR-like protein [Trametes punicea]